METNLKTFSDGEVYFWIEQGTSIQMKACTPNFHDPVELTAREAKEIGQELIKLAEILEKYENS